MASYTTNLNLKKPAGSENVAIGDINNNMDAIDTAYGALDSKLTLTSIGTVSDLSSFQSKIEEMASGNGFFVWTISNSNANNIGLANASHFGFVLSDSTRKNMIVVAFRLNGSEIKINTKANESWSNSWKAYSGA